jgi:hypothetical protein
MENLKNLRVPWKQIEEEMRKKRAAEDRNLQIDKEAQRVCDNINAAIEHNSVAIRVKSISSEVQCTLESNGFAVNKVPNGSMLLCYPPIIQYEYIISWSDVAVE